MQAARKSSPKEAVIRGATLDILAASGAAGGDAEARIGADGELTLEEREAIKACLQTA